MVAARRGAAAFELAEELAGVTRLPLADRDGPARPEPKVGCAFSQIVLTVVE